MVFCEKTHMDKFINHFRLIIIVIIAVTTIPIILDIAEFIKGVSGDDLIPNIFLTLITDTKESSK